MRNSLANPQVTLLKYGIREIVDVAQKLGEMDKNFHFISENIGDPIAKSWTVPPFLKHIIKEEVERPGFFSPHYGFRLTTLDRDELRRKDTYQRMSKAVEAYLKSA